MTLADKLSEWLYRDHGTTFQHVEGHDRVCDVETVTRLTERPDLDIGDERSFIDFAIAEPWDALTEILEQANLDIPAEDLMTEFTNTLEAYR